MYGFPIRQEYSETAIEWIAARDGLASECMALHQQDNANQIWRYFRHFIGVVEAISTVKPKEMKGIEWDAYNRFKEMESDHLRPEARGGKTIPENCKMRCRECNRRKSNI